MKKHFGLSLVKYRKLKELLSAEAKWWTISKAGDIRYANNVLGYIFHPMHISLPVFCMTVLPGTYKVSDYTDHTIDQIIDIAYSHFILGAYDLSSMGADYKFNTIRNVFAHHFKSKAYVINHYSNRLSMPVIKLLKKEFADRDILNLLIPERTPLLNIVRDYKHGIIDHVRKQFSLMRAGPYETRPILLVA